MQWKEWVNYNNPIQHELSTYLNFLKQPAFRAGRITLSYYSRGIYAELKSDESLITDTDRDTKNLFAVRSRRKAYPAHAIVGEEFGENVSGGGIRSDGSWIPSMGPVFSV
jgi:fructose-1,6-bisphosphatase/inositol monophosphatase family enzyme